MTPATGAYNVDGIGLAAMGWLPPVAAAAAQSLPDVAMMLNASRLLRDGTGPMEAWEDRTFR